jgi:hypothetical protein
MGPPLFVGSLEIDLIIELPISSQYSKSRNYASAVSVGSAIGQCSVTYHFSAFLWGSRNFDLRVNHDLYLVSIYTSQESTCAFTGIYC